MKGPENDAVELHWTAFRYIADEMTSDERESFEEQLAQDQQAREAVAGVVELSQSVVLAVESTPVVQAAAPRGSRLAPLAWMSLGASLCLAVMLTLRPASPDTPGMAALPEATPELAQHWASSSPVTAGEEADWNSPLPADPLEHAVLSDAAESDIPTWLMAAVSARKDAPISNEN